MRQSEQINELAGALAKAQGQFANPERNREVAVNGTTKSGKDFTYTFKYATFDAILDMVRKPLSENGLALLQGVASTETGMMLTTKLLHGSGQWIESDTPVFYSEDKAQAFGSGVSYAKRYAVAALLGITADEDDDGNNAEGNRAKFKDRAPRNPPPRSVERGTPLADARREIDAGTASTVPQGKPATSDAPLSAKEWANGAAGHQWIQGTAIVEIKAIGNAQAVTEWEQANAGSLDALAEHCPKRHDWLKNKIDEHRDYLTNLRAAG